MREEIELRNKIQEEAISKALHNQYGTIVCPVRTGKTLIGLRIAQNYRKVLVSYPNRSIYESWKDDSRKFNINDDHITYTTHLSLSKHNLSDFDIVILDELHSVSISQINTILENIPKRMIGLTATPSNFGEKASFMRKYLPIIYELKLSETVGILNKDYLIKIHLLQPSRIKNIRLARGGTWSEYDKIKFFERKYQNSKRFTDMLFLIRAISTSKTKLDHLIKLSKEIDRGLFFVNDINQCEETGLAAYHSKESTSEDNLKLFQEEKINKLVTISQLKQGITFKNLNDLVILHTYSSNNQAHQKLGRALNYSEEIANIHILCLKDTYDEKWVKSSLEDMDQEKIIYIKY